jgi:hypothetical protein
MSDKEEKMDQESNDDHSDTRSDTSSESSQYQNIMKHMLNLYEHGLITPEDLSSILERLKDKRNEKDWTKEYTDIIACICEKAQCYRYMHEKSSYFYKNLSKKFIYSNMALSFILSSFTIVFSELNTIDTKIVSLVSGIGHLMVASLTGIHKKMKLAEKSEIHSKSCIDFDSFCRELEYQLRLPVEDRQIVPKYILSSIDKYENIVYSAPKIPLKILSAFRYFASSNLDIDQPSIVKTFTNVHDLSNDDIYYEDGKENPPSKYMCEFFDIKQFNHDSSKYKHKKTNRTPKMKRVHKQKIKKDSPRVISEQIEIHVDDQIKPQDLLPKQNSVENFQKTDT